MRAIVLAIGLMLATGCGGASTHSAHQLRPRFAHHDTLRATWDPAKKLWIVTGEIENLTELNWALAYSTLIITGADGEDVGDGAFMLVDFKKGDKRQFEAEAHPIKPSASLATESVKIEMNFLPASSTIAQ